MRAERQFLKSPGGMDPNSSRIRPLDPPSSEVVTIPAIFHGSFSLTASGLRALRVPDKPVPPPRATTLSGLSGVSIKIFMSQEPVSKIVCLIFFCKSEKLIFLISCASGSSLQRKTIFLSRPMAEFKAKEH